MPRIFRTLQFRLAAAFVLWTALLQVALLLGIPLLREPYVIEQLDRAIAAQTSEVPRRLAAMGGVPAEVEALGELSIPAGKGAGPIVAQFRDLRGRVLASSPAIETVTLPLHPERVSRERPYYETVVVPPAPGEDEPRRRYRIVTYLIEPVGAEPYYAQIGSSLAAIDRAHEFLTKTLVAALVAGTLGAGIAGWVVAGAVAARIKRVTGAVRQVSPNRLEDLLDVPESDDEIGRMAAEVNAMLRRLADAVQSHERFISHVSHELKTPVSALLTEAQVLKYQKPDERAYENFVLGVEDEMRRLGRMVESFLMLARFGHGRRFLAETLVPINDIALESVEHSSLLAWQHGVTLGLTLYDPGSSEPEALVRGDAELLRVVVDNLIRNAIQFSKAKMRVHVTVECANGYVVLTVTDEGPGIPEEYLERVFDRFVQAPSVPDAGRRGTGLGLTIAKGVVDLHGGDIRVRNRPEGGCAFTVRLPLAVVPNSPGGTNGSIAEIHIPEAIPSPR